MLSFLGGLPSAFAGHGLPLADEEGEYVAPSSISASPILSQPNSLTVELPGTKRTPGGKDAKDPGAVTEKVLPSTLAQSVAVIVYAEAKDRGASPDDERWRTLPDRLQLVARRNVPMVRFVKLPNLSMGSISHAWKLIDQAVRGEKLAISSISLILSTTSRTRDGDTELLTDDGYLSGKQIGPYVHEFLNKKLAALHDLMNPVETVLFTNWTNGFDCNKFPGQVAGFSKGAIRNFDMFMKWYGRFFNTQKASMLPMRAEEWYKSWKPGDAEPEKMATLCTPKEVIMSAAGLPLPVLESLR